MNRHRPFAWVLLVAACAGPEVDVEVPTETTLAPDSALTLGSTAFAEGGTLPASYTCDGAGLSPPLSWRNAPAGTKGFALLMTTQARDGLKWNWVLYDIPAEARSLDAGVSTVGTAGLTSDGPNLAYSPPCSQGPGAKSYTFTLYALSGSPRLPPDPRDVTGAVLASAVDGVTLGRASMSVSYTR